MIKVCQNQQTYCKRQSVLQSTVLRKMRGISHQPLTQTTFALKCVGIDKCVANVKMCCNRQMSSSQMLNVPQWPFLPSSMFALQHSSSHRSNAAVSAFQRTGKSAQCLRPPTESHDLFEFDAGNQEQTSQRGFFTKAIAGCCLCCQCMQQERPSHAVFHKTRLDSSFSPVHDGGF
jgi:hypothetical protein